MDRDWLTGRGSGDSVTERINEKTRIRFIERVNGLQPELEPDRQDQIAHLMQLIQQSVPIEDIERLETVYDDREFLDKVLKMAEEPAKKKLRELSTPGEGREYSLAKEGIEYVLTRGSALGVLAIDILLYDDGLLWFFLTNLASERLDSPYTESYTDFKVEYWGLVEAKVTIENATEFLNMSDDELTSNANAMMKNRSWAP